MSATMWKLTGVPSPHPERHSFPGSTRTRLTPTHLANCAGANQACRWKGSSP